MKSIHGSSLAAAVLLVAFAVVSSPMRATAAASAADWSPAVWHGERAFSSQAQGWKAIVSIERGRLIYFGRAAGDTNLLRAPATRDRPFDWGGHRLWLGPQYTWPGGWPPPVAWEKSAAESAAVTGGRLQLVVPDAGGGWPRIVREYYWRDGQLHCAARIHGGTRPAQVIHIVQLPPTAEVEVRATPKAAIPNGYVVLAIGTPTPPKKIFTPPPHVSGPAEKLKLQYLDRVEKLGFLPQTLVARIGGWGLRVGRGATEGRAVTTPDEGFVTQVYLGNDSTPVIELEQLSPTWAAGTDACFELTLEGVELSKTAP
jgi:hypothetical protein